MNLYVFTHTLGRATRTTVSLCLGTASFFYIVLYGSSTFYGNSAPDIPWLRDPPRGMRAMLGGTADFLHAAGWLSTGMSHPITLALFTSGALTVAVGGVAGEIERGTIEFVLTRPVTRRRYLTAIAAAALVVVTAVQLSGLLVTLLARQTVDGVDQLGVAQVLRPFAGSWLLFAAISQVSLLVSATVSLRGRALALSAGFVVLSFFANFAAMMIDQLSGLRLASVFHYVQPATLLNGHGLTDLAMPAAVGVVALAIALVLFGRRDIVR
ncbi:MAG TPA: ABC transporter permease subunit [Pseudonocardiaceae bacterium]